MYSNRSEHSYRRQHSDRSARHYDDRREDRCEPHRDVPRDSFRKRGGDGYSRAERRNPSREYSDSPPRRYGKDAMSRDWSRKSPVRRRGASPDNVAAEQKRRRFGDHHVVDGHDNHRYRREPEEKAYRHSPDSFSRQPKDFKYRQTSQDSRHRHEEFTYGQQRDNHRPVSGFHKDGDHRERSWEHSDGATQYQGSATNSFGKARERDDSPSRSHVDHHRQHQSSERFPLNEPCGQSFERDLTNQTPTTTNEGFQRFLNVLNKGVNMATLTKIVTCPSSEANDRPLSPAPVTDTAKHLWSPGKQQGIQQNSCDWSESEGSQRPASPQPHYRSFSSVGRSLSDDVSQQRCDGGQSHQGVNSRSRSPSVVEKITMTPEDEHRHKQIQDVLQAIGLDLGSDELGQMSHRIQERLYGKKDGDRGRCCRGSGERDTRRALSPKRQSRSSSSNGSNFSSLTGDSCLKKDTCSVQRDVTEGHSIQVIKTVEYVHNNSSISVQDGDKREDSSQETTVAFQTSRCNTYSVPEPCPAAPLMYSPVNCSPMPYSLLPPPLPPNLLHVRPSVFLPPYLPYPPVPPVNVFPAVLPPNHLLPQHIVSPQTNLQIQNQHQPLKNNNAQKSKTQSRPRCLQVIQTKQPG